MLCCLFFQKCDFVPVGPTNSNVAREQQPNTIRAKFGTDGSMNAVHGSANPEDARREINFFFPNFVVDPVPTKEQTDAYLQANVMPTLSEGLLELCKVKPQNPTVCHLITHDCIPLVYSPLGMVRLLAIRA